MQEFLIETVTKYLRNLCDNIGLYCCKCYIFQLLARNGRNEVKVVRLIELILKILIMCTTHFTNLWITVLLYINSNCC